MGLLRRGGRWHFSMRVPRRFAHVDGREYVRASLHTDSERIARAKAAALEADFIAYWEALAAGDASDALARYEAARRLAAARGWPYRPAADLARPEALADLVARANSLASPSHVAPAAEVAAVLGLVDPPPLRLSEALARFFDLTRDRVAEKSAKQAYRWRLDRERGVANFIVAVGDKPLAEITRADAVTYRTWWADKLAKDGLNPDSANKDFGHLSDVFRTVSDLLGLGLENPFKGLRFRKLARVLDVPPFSPDWIKSRLLAAGALDGLNAEARDVFLVLVNTGARPSEVLGALAADFRVDAEVPHLAILPRDGRALKTPQSEREVPLAGVSLAAARRIVARGGLSPRYFLKADTWSAAVNKYLRENNLRETPRHRAYSLRHAFEDRLLEAGVDDRLRAELMGHKYARPAYGRGGSLPLKARAVASVAF